MDVTSGKELCWKVLDMARKAGVQQSDVILQRGHSLSLQAQGGKLDKTKVTSTQVLGIRVLQDQKVGISATESLDEDSLMRMIDQALGASRYAHADPYQRIEQKNAADIIHDDPKLNQADQASLQEKVEVAMALERQVLEKDKRIHNAPYSGYSDGDGEYFYANHLGTFCYQRARSFSCYTSALAGEEGAQAMFSGSSISRNFQGLSVEACVEEASSNALSLLSAKSIPTGRYDVIFRIDEWESLMSAFLGAFSAKAAMEGTAYYRDKVGQTMASSLLYLRDCPQYADGFSPSLFDDEGAPRKDLTLIDRGELKSLLHNSATARYYKLPNTAHGARGARSSLGTGATQLVLEPGTSTESDLYAGQVLKVIDLKGLHSGTNAISGHFSLAIEGILYQNGQIQQYVKDVTLSGNFYELIKEIQAAGKVLEASSSLSFFSPTLRFGGLSLAGA